MVESLYSSESMELTYDAPVFILTMTHTPDGKGSFENRFNPTFVDNFHKCLDAVLERADGPAALVITSKGKFFSNGLDLDTMLAPDTSPDVMQQIPAGLHNLLGRLIDFGVPTVAAINGHAFAGGFMLAQSCDYRVVNSEKGFMCMNEVELQLPLSTAMNALLKDKLPGGVFRDTMLHARRWKGPEGAEAGFCDIAVPAADVLAEAVQLAQLHAPRGANTDVYARLKGMMWLEAKKALTAGGTVKGMAGQAAALEATFAKL